MLKLRIAIPKINLENLKRDKGSAMTHQSIKILQLLCLCIFLNEAINAQEFKTIGYFPHYRLSHIEEIDFTSITHCNIAFANPDLEGNLSFDGSDITPIIEKAHDHDVVVLISLAGGYLKPEWEEAWNHLMKTENRSAFIHKMISYAKNLGIEGIDVDLEWSYVNELYSPFVLELRDSTLAHNLLLTAALPGTHRFPPVSDEVIAQYDWINMMVYDLKGPWDPSNAGPHSPYSFAVNSIAYWENQGVEKERLTLGVPFYGYDFSNSNKTTALTYNQIVNLDPENANNDVAGDIYYNGMPTIRAKTELALEELGGIMIWELGQDHFSQYSLLNVISETVNELFSSIEESPNNTLASIPNPFYDQIIIEGKKNNVARFYDMVGHLVFEYKLQNDLEAINTSSLIPGLYVLSIFSESNVKSRKLIKQ